MFSMWSSTWCMFMNSMRLRSLLGVFLGCTALMRANSPKHPCRCLQFAKIGDRKEKTTSVCLHVCVCVCVGASSCV